MSEKEKNEEIHDHSSLTLKEVNEEVILDHFYHEHPLILTETVSGYEQCFGCRRYIFSGETVYRCHRKCLRSPILHEECAEMPREITVSIHPQHTLIQKEVLQCVSQCAVCESSILKIGYYCTSWESCKFQIHVGCAQSTGVMHAAAGERSCMQHPSHPQHELTLLWRPGRSSSLRCDACGTIHKGNSYICIVCQYWIHATCAALPTFLTYPHHYHPLSLVFRLPQEYIIFDFKCDICFKDLHPKYWVYHCQICRYVVHIQCAIKTSPATTIFPSGSNIDANAADDEDKDFIAFPINNAVEELIAPFVMKKIGGILSIPDDNEMVKGKYKFHNQDHQLRLISSSLHDQDEEKENSDDDDDLLYGLKSELECDGCTTPIFQKKQKSSSLSSDNHSSNYYISCVECKYFLHLACFHLPHELHSHPLHLEPDHNLVLQTTSPKFNFTSCHICRFYTNGLFYGCTKCYFKADIKCVSLPDTIKHAAHPRHLLKVLTKEITRESSYWRLRMCGACGHNTYADVCYKCDICEIILHSSCALLPASVSNPRWDKHPLPLTFDASVNHPSDFYCDVCEQEMNPKRWMYHIRDSDLSFHPRCFPTASGEYRNIKFGQRYLVAAVHPHPIAYQLLTIKLRCDVCGKRKDYGSRGFQCASQKCDFFMCLVSCGRDCADAMQLAGSSEI